MYGSKARVWEMAMHAALISCTDLQSRNSAVDVAKRAAVTADAALEEFEKRQKDGKFNDPGQKFGEEH